MNAKLQKLKELLKGYSYREEIPHEALKYATDNNLLIVIGGSDDLVYFYGADCCLTREEELYVCYEGCILYEYAEENESDKCIVEELKQLGLKVYWSGKMERFNKIETRSDYDKEKYSKFGFSYEVEPSVESLDFIVYEDSEEDGDIYCQGLLIQLPKNFKKG